MDAASNWLWLPPAWLWLQPFPTWGLHELAAPAQAQSIIDHRLGGLEASLDVGGDSLAGLAGNGLPGAQGWESCSRWG